MRKNSNQILAICALTFLSFGSYTFLSSMQVESQATVEQAVVGQEDEKQVMIQLPDVSIVQKAIEIGEKLFNAY